MVRKLLVRGIVSGLLAGLLVFLAARLIGEPQVDRAIAFEANADKLKNEAPEPEMVSRKIQKTAGLLTGVLVYGAALGGIFGLVFALCSGRVGPQAPRALAAFLGGAGFIVIGLVPSLKYPANPPAVGSPETIGVRTATFFFMILISVAAAVLSLQLSRPLMRRFGGWNGSLLAATAFLLLVGVFSFVLPVINEVPAGFPADVLWRFRIAALGLQAILWAAIGLSFGWLTERETRRV
ncbi:CbtA family protein [Granulicella arctica]|uniref:CbtA family protein n=1 Tax=Granulicella arctica TaxID=940613 RepID=UPI0021E0BA6D|nr:CbtA family protein [Granulicella arctica]